MGTHRLYLKMVKVQPMSQGQKKNLEDRGTLEFKMIQEKGCCSGRTGFT